MWFRRSVLTIAFSISAAFVAAAPPVLNVDLGNGVSMELVLISKGDFVQGSPPTEAERGEDEVAHKVTLTRDYYLGKTAVTRDQWERFTADTQYRTEAERGPSGGFGWDGEKLTQRKEFSWRNPGFAQSGDHPVCVLTHSDAEAFCRWLSHKAGRKASLPTEAQWEYACRAGSTGAWHNNGTKATATEIGWSKQNAGNMTHPAAGAKPNAWGLFMGGNAAEWCQDWYAPYPQVAATDPVQNQSTTADRNRRVLRGGSWNRDIKNTRSAARFRADQFSRNADIGFRVVLAADAPPAETAPTAPVPSGSGFQLPRMNPDSSGTAAPSPPIPQNQYAETPAIPHSGIFDGLLGLSCAVCPVAVIVVIFVVVLKVARRGSRGAKSAGFGAGAGGRADVRMADDGFWLQLEDVPNGAKVDYEISRFAGSETTESLDYQPGPQGHFVYTGYKPATVRIIHVSSAGGPLPSTSVMHDPGPGGRGFTGGPSSISRPYRGPSTLAEDPPPRYPSAY